MTPDGTTAILDFDPAAYPFHELIARYVGRDDLEAVASEVPATGVGEGASLYRNMESSPYHKAMYAALQGPAGEEFYAMYRRFVREVIQPQYGEDLYYQRRPSHRMLFRDAPGESRYHRDRDYGHDPAEVNYWVPQTRAFDTNSIWLESREDAGDFAPAELELGQYLRFDGANLRHGAKVNRTDRTRVSFDFRVVPASAATEEIRTSAERADTAAKDASNPVMGNARVFELMRG